MRVDKEVCKWATSRVKRWATLRQRSGQRGVKNRWATRRYRGGAVMREEEVGNKESKEVGN